MKAQIASRWEESALWEIVSLDMELGKGSIQYLEFLSQYWQKQESQVEYQSFLSLATIEGNSNIEAEKIKLSIY